MQLLRVAKGRMKPVPPDLSSQKRLSQLGHNSVHLHPSLGLHHRKLRIIGHRNHSVRRSLLPYQKEMAIRTAPPDSEVINHVSTATNWVIGPRNAPTPRRIATRIRTIRDKRMPGHVRETCIIPLWKKCPLEKLSRLVCFSSTSILLLFYLIRELLIHL